MCNEIERKTLIEKKEEIEHKKKANNEGENTVVKRRRAITLYRERGKREQNRKNESERGQLKVVEREQKENGRW